MRSKPLARHANTVLRVSKMHLLSTLHQPGDNAATPLALACYPARFCQIGGGEGSRAGGCARLRQMREKGRGGGTPGGAVPQAALRPSSCEAGWHGQSAMGRSCVTRPALAFPTVTARQGQKTTRHARNATRSKMAVLAYTSQ